MPFVNVKVIEGVLSAAEKKEVIRRMTDALAAVKGESFRQAVWVVIEEVKGGAWAIGGKPLTAADVRAMVAGRSGTRGRARSRRAGRARSRQRLMAGARRP